MESFEECALREIAEECGIEVANIRFQYLANIKPTLPNTLPHWSYVYWAGGEPVLEPEKCKLDGSLQIAFPYV